MAAAATAPAPVEVVRVRLVDLRPPPRLRALTWASAEWACALLRLPDGSPLTLATALAACAPDAAAENPGLVGAVRASRVEDAEGFVRAACGDRDPGATLALRVCPHDEIAEIVKGAFLDALAQAEAEAERYAAVRRATFPEEPYGRSYAAWRAGGGSDGLPVPFPAAVTSQGPEAWAALHSWPLAKTLQYLEDVAVQAFFRELQEVANEAQRGGAKHG